MMSPGSLGVLRLAGAEAASQILEQHGGRAAAHLPDADLAIELRPRLRDAEVIPESAEPDGQRAAARERRRPERGVFPVGPEVGLAAGVALEPAAGVEANPLVGFRLPQIEMSYCLPAVPVRVRDQ
jgi:hypothetical protein